MRHALILSAALLGLAACGGSGADGEDAAGKEEAGWRDACITIANDEEGQEEIAGMGTDADGFCDCADKFIAEMPAEDQEKAKTTMIKVADGMNEGGQSTEDVVGKMMSDAMSKPDDPDAQAMSEGVRLVGRMIDDIDSSYEDNGSCVVG
ncbi:hypothetical protein [Henriciella aquimarina]|uniref:hypothetical protein n=1 Tax=Henriciella aquimarina TaxID=545261 RepID=UPI000A06D1D4|nr:hypothetical protein [Henriciella aquimarina]